MSSTVLTLATASQPLSQTSKLEKTHDQLTSRMRMIGRATPVAFRKGMSLSTDEKTEVSQMVSAVRASLGREADAKDCAKAVRLILGGWPPAQGSDLEGIAEAYRLGLRGCSSAALREAVEQALSSGSEFKDFRPSAPQLAAVCKRIEGHWAAFAAQIEKLSNLPEEAA